MARRRRRLWVLLPLLLGTAPLLFARAGGGGHYSGGEDRSGGGFGGGFSGGGSGGGDALGALFYLYIQLLVAHPLVGLPLTAILAYVALQVYSSSDVLLASSDAMHSTIARGSEMQEARGLRENLARLAGRDPGFSAPALLERVKGAFLKIQEAWSAQDMSSARAFISDGVMERFSLQIEMQKADRKRNPMADVRILAAAILEVESDKYFDTLHVRLAASAIDKEVSLDDGRLLFGSEEPREFVEIWSFVRRPGAKTLRKPGLLEGFCPSCGAPLPIADAALCQACKTWVNSGEYDWVLCEITQEEEWAVRGSGEDVPGFPALAAKDPALSTQFLEDRASVAFWRWQWALSQKSAAPMLSVAADSFCAALESEASAKGTYYRDAAAGMVEVQAFEQGPDFDRAHVMVKWSGEWFSSEGGSTASKGQVLRQHVFILGRKAGVKTDARAGLRSCRCAQCGAPPARRDQARCEYCGMPFNDGSRQWTVFEIVPIGLWKKPAAVTGTPAFDADWARGLSPVDGLALLLAAMTADGQVDEQELALIKAYAEDRGMTAETVGRMSEAAREGHLALPKPSSLDQARACLRGLAQMSLADGQVSDQELKLMAAFGKPFGLTEADVWAVVKQERTALYRQAKKELTGPLSL